jgi:hypothetical protein
VFEPPDEMRPIVNTLITGVIGMNVHATIVLFSCDR